MTSRELPTATKARCLPRRRASRWARAEERLGAGSALRLAGQSHLGPEWQDRLAPLRRKRQLIAELERLSGKKVMLQEAA
jgi:hypothetical protein